MLAEEVLNIDHVKRCHVISRNRDQSLPVVASGKVQPRKAANVSSATICYPSRLTALRLFFRGREPVENYFQCKHLRFTRSVIPRISLYWDQIWGTLLYVELVYHSAAGRTLIVIKKKFSLTAWRENINHHQFVDKFFFSVKKSSGKSLTADKTLYIKIKLINPRYINYFNISALLSVLHSAY